MTTAVARLLARFVTLPLHDGAALDVRAAWDGKRLAVTVNGAELTDVKSVALAISSGKPGLEFVREMTPFNTHTRQRALLALTRIESFEIRAKVKA